MAHLGFIGEGKQVRVDFFAGQGLQREGRDEMGAGFGENGFHGTAGFGEEADEFERLVGGDAAGDDQEDAFALQAHRRQPLWIAAMPPERLR